MNANATILNEIKAAVVSVDPGAEVILFGSRARGDYYEESDWDVVILADRKQNDREFKRKIRHALLNVEMREGIVIVALVRNRMFWKNLAVTPFFKEVERDGMLL